MGFDTERGDALFGQAATRLIDTVDEWSDMIEEAGRPGNTKGTRP